MSVRIRSLKPEWLEDEKMASRSDEARVLSVALILMSDDYGRGRASLATIAAGAWRYQMERDDGAHAPETLARASRALRELVASGFVELYEVSGQRYFAIRNWSKHQKVDRPSKPRIPEPPAAQASENTREPEHSRDTRETLASLSTHPRETLDADQGSGIRDQDHGSGSVDYAHAREDHHPTPPREGPTPAGIVEAEYRTALGTVRAAYSPRTGDPRHFRDAADAMRATVTDRPLRDVAREWCALYVAEKRSRSPEWLAEWCQRRAASGGVPKGGRAEPLPASAYQGTTDAELDEWFGTPSAADLDRVNRGVRHG